MTQGSWWLKLNMFDSFKHFQVILVIVAISVHISLTSKLFYFKIATKYAKLACTLNKKMRDTARGRHQTQTVSMSLALCEGNPSVTSGFPSQRPVMRSFDVIVDIRLDKRLSKQSRRRWFETSSHSLWRHCNGLIKKYRQVSNIRRNLVGN